MQQTLEAPLMAGIAAGYFEPACANCPACKGKHVRHICNAAPHRRPRQPSRSTKGALPGSRPFVRESEHHVIFAELFPPDPFLRVEMEYGLTFPLCSGPDLAAKNSHVVGGHQPLSCAGVLWAAEFFAEVFAVSTSRVRVKDAVIVGNQFNTITCGFGTHYNKGPSTPPAGASRPRV